jgi:hypothetical protein
MATVVEDAHSHGHEHVIERDRSDSSGMSFLIGIVLILLMAFLIFYYGLPALRSTGTTVNVPKSIDVNVNQPAQPAQ